MMKTIFIFLFSLQGFILNAQDFLQSEVFTNNQGTQMFVINDSEHHKFQSFDKTKLEEMLKSSSSTHPLVKTGKTLTFVGVPLILVGAILVSNADALYYECYNGDCTGDPKGGFGIVSLVAGVGLTGTGIVLWTIGKNK